MFNSPNKFLLVGIFLILLIGGIVMYILSDQNDNKHLESMSNDITTGQSFVFVCSDNTSFTIAYGGHDNDLARLTIDGNVIELTRAVSASGARYTSDAEGIEFWEHAGSARIERNGKLQHENCVLETDEIESSNKEAAVYRNERYGFSVRYPADVFNAVKESQNGDGAVITATYTSATIRVFGAQNALDETMTDIIAAEKKILSEIQR